jgi:hypothetical protein
MNYFIENKINESKSVAVKSADLELLISLPISIIILLGINLILGLIIVG